MRSRAASFPMALTPELSQQIDAVDFSSFELSILVSFNEVHLRFPNDIFFSLLELFSLFE